MDNNYAIILLILTVFVLLNINFWVLDDAKHNWKM